MIIIALTPNGAELALRISKNINSQICLSEKLKEITRLYDNISYFDNLDEIICAGFEKKEPLAFIMATGIVVRKICPYLKGKAKDPPVIVMDEKGRHIISLVSGHLGGANALSEKIAAITGGEAVITTATDVNSLTAIDILAKDHGLIIENLDMVKKINYAILTNEKINLVDPEEVTDKLNESFNKINFKDALINCLPTVYISSYNPLNNNLQNWLFLRPNNLIVGIGCNRGAIKNEIIDFIKEIFEKYRLAIHSIKGFASINLKMDEAGIIETAKYFGVDIKWYSKEILSEMNVPNPSEIVRKNMGTAGVCEAAAMIASKNSRLLVTKQKKGNVTIAVAKEASR
jgi:cobalt-precorrin 5A hydrolase